MRHFAYLLLLFGLLTGCEKRPSSYLPGAPTGGVTVPAPEGDPIYLMMGQSNMANMPQSYISAPLAQMGRAGNVFQCASGGSRLSEWQKGTPLYNRALQTYLDNKRNGRLAGIFFWQGEAEGVWGSQGEAESWAQRFTQFVRDFRADTGEPDLKVVFMQIGILDSYPYATTVKTQQASVYIPGVVMTKTDGYPVDADGHHFSGHSQELGERMAAAMVSND